MVSFYKHTRKAQRNVSGGGFKGSETGIEEKATKLILLWGVIFQMSPNYIAEAVWKGPKY